MTRRKAIIVVRCPVFGLLRAGTLMVKPGLPDSSLLLRDQGKVNKKSAESQQEANEAMWGDDADQVFHISRIWNTLLADARMPGEAITRGIQLKYQECASETPIEQRDMYRRSAGGVRVVYGKSQGSK